MMSASRQSFITDKSVECETRVDTSSSDCIFKGAHGESLGLDIESTVAENIGIPYRFAQGASSHRHHRSLGIRSEATVYFAADEQFTRSVLGRTGWLNCVKLGLIDYAANLLLSPYF
jgi:hypothetical protein